MSSSPAAATDVAWPSPRPLQACPTGASGSAWTCGVTVSACCAENERDSSHQPERVGQPQRQRAQQVAPAHVGAHAVDHPAPAVGLDLVQHEPRPRAEHVGHPVLDQQRAGGQPGDVLQPQVHARLLADRRPAPAPARGGTPPGSGCAPSTMTRDQRQQRQQQRRPAAGRACSRGACRSPSRPARRPGRSGRGWSGRPARRRAAAAGLGAAVLSGGHGVPSAASGAAGCAAATVRRALATAACSRSATTCSGVRPAHLGLGGGQQAVREDRARPAPGRRRAARSRGRPAPPPRARPRDQLQRGAGRGAEAQVGAVAGGGRPGRRRSA